jgi:transcriptional regulator with XRE-family HTH domain
MKVRQVGRFIREQRRAVGLSVRKLASLAGVSNPYLSQIERGLRRPSAEILNGIAKALRISSETLYVQAGILDPRQDTDLRTAIQADRTISPKQKEVLLSVYESFREETARRRRRRAPESEATPRRAAKTPVAMAEASPATHDVPARNGGRKAAAG